MSASASKKKNKGAAVSASANKRVKPPAKEDEKKSQSQLLREAMAMVSAHAASLCAAAKAEKQPDSAIGAAQQSLSAFSTELATIQRLTKEATEEFARQRYDQLVNDFIAICEADAREPIPFGARENLWTLELHRRLGYADRRDAKDEARIKAQWGAEKLPFDVKETSWYGSEVDEADHAKFVDSYDVWAADSVVENMQKSNPTTFGKYCEWKHGNAILRAYERTVAPLFNKPTMADAPAGEVWTSHRHEAECLKSWTSRSYANSNFIEYVVKPALAWRLAWLADRGAGAHLPCPDVADDDV